MTIELSWSMVGVAFGAVALVGVGIGTIAYHGVKAYRRARGLDKAEANRQAEQIIKNYKELYESERENSRHQISLLTRQFNELRDEFHMRVSQLEAEVSQYRTQNSSLQSLLCPFRASCPWTHTEKGPPNNN